MSGIGGWRKSSYSDVAGNNCVEVAAAGDTVRVRDSKRIRGAQLGVPARVWAAFVTYMRGHAA
ncbi:DUF397 domain-containing protein [Streptomyces hiroshimensis]|uniref:DUF397 domain-containing protein n=1 Tax=Streptomyces hiroshimensis TaxID=66424 RepID=A0ABQ2YBZ9_9ACTN|nr:DUF397 domain-containing protein [Streptomyces hiroshimensis]GGX78852.1 hypothetical protein GCM10010324_25520 [Streptomyces hiroshimensis]